MLRYHYSRRLVMFSLAALLGLTSHASISDEIAQFVDLPRLKSDIAKAVAEARLIHPEEPFFIINRIELKLQGTLRGEGDVEFSIPVWVFEVDLGAEGTFEQNETLEVALIPAETAIVGGDSLVDFSPLIQTLKQTFSSEHDDGLQAESITFTRRWALQRHVTGDVDAIIVKFGGSISDDKAQSVSFHLCQTIDLETCVSTN